MLERLRDAIGLENLVDDSARPQPSKIIEAGDLGDISCVAMDSRRDPSVPSESGIHHLEPGVSDGNDRDRPSTVMKPFGGSSSVHARKPFKPCGMSMVCLTWPAAASLASAKLIGLLKATKDKCATWAQVLPLAERRFENEITQVQTRS
jgi:hypothetical protein